MYMLNNVHIIVSKAISQTRALTMSVIAITFDFSHPNGVMRFLAIKIFT